MTTKTEGPRVLVRGRRGTLVLSTQRRFTEQEMDTLIRQLRSGLNRTTARFLILDGCRVDAVIPAGLRRSRALRRPRWAR